VNNPVLVAVDDDPDVLRDVERELRNRYASDYRLCFLRSADEALATLEELGEKVALALAGEGLSGRPVRSCWRMCGSVPARPARAGSRGFSRSATSAPGP
jgi:hypothetical protein